MQRPSHITVIITAPNEREKEKSRDTFPSSLPLSVSLTTATVTTSSSFLFPFSSAFLFITIIFSSLLPLMPEGVEGPAFPLPSQPAHISSFHCQHRGHFLFRPSHSLQRERLFLLCTEQ